MRFTALFVLAASVTSIFADVIQVQNDINQKIGPQITTLNNDVQAFPNSGLTGALTIHKDFQTLTDTFNTATNNVKSTGSFGLASGTTILGQIQSLIPTFLATLVNIGLQESSWAAIQGGTALVLSDLQSLNTATSNYIDAITAAEPILQKPPCYAIKAQVTGAFTTTIGYYTVSG